MRRYKTRRSRRVQVDLPFLRRWTRSLPPLRVVFSLGMVAVQASQFVEQSDRGQPERLSCVACWFQGERRAEKKKRKQITEKTSRQKQEGGEERVDGVRMLVARVRRRRDWSHDRKSNGGKNRGKCLLESKRARLQFDRGLIFCDVQLVLVRGDVERKMVDAAPRRPREMGKKHFG